MDNAVANVEDAEPGPQPLVRVLVVEDDDLTRDTLAEALATQPGMQVVGLAATSQEALELLRHTQPDVALVDLNLGNESGIDLIRQFKEEQAGMQMMAHTVLDDRDAVFRAIKAGAVSYVLKGCSVVELAAALREVHAGGGPMTPRIARMVIQELAAHGEPDPLSPRERQILRHIDAGLTYKEIANNEHLSTHTVHSHIKNIYERLHASGKKDALAKARRHGML